MFSAECFISLPFSVKSLIYLDFTVCGVRRGANILLYFLYCSVFLRMERNVIILLAQFWAHGGCSVKVVAILTCFSFDWCGSS